MVEVAAIFRRHGPVYRTKCGDRMPQSPLEAMAALAQGRTETLGGHGSQCLAGGDWAYRSHACNNRHCPTCQHDEATRWLAQQRALLRPVPSFLVTLTLPEILRPMARSHQHLMSNLRLQTSAAALQTLALAPQSVGGQIGLVGVLPTWTRERAYHPPIDSLVPGGALAPDGWQWLSPRYQDWLVPVHARSTLFRRKCKAALTTASLLTHVPPQVWPKG